MQKVTCSKVKVQDFFSVFVQGLRFLCKTCIVIIAFEFTDENNVLLKNC